MALQSMAEETLRVSGDLDSRVQELMVKPYATEGPRVLSKEEIQSLATQIQSTKSGGSMPYGITDTNGVHGPHHYFLVLTKEEARMVAAASTPGWLPQLLVWNPAILRVCKIQQVIDTAPTVDISCVSLRNMVGEAFWKAFCTNVSGTLRTTGDVVVTLRTDCSAVGHYISRSFGFPYVGIRASIGNNHLSTR